jgi:hypothetical protein
MFSLDSGTSVETRKNVMSGRVHVSPDQREVILDEFKRNRMPGYGE